MHTQLYFNLAAARGRHIVFGELFQETGFTNGNEKSNDKRGIRQVHTFGQSIVAGDVGKRCLGVEMVPLWATKDPLKKEEI